MEKNQLRVTFQRGITDTVVCVLWKIFTHQSDLKSGNIDSDPIEYSNLLIRKQILGLMRL